MGKEDSYPDRIYYEKLIKVIENNPTKQLKLYKIWSGKLISSVIEKVYVNGDTGKVSIKFWGVDDI